MNTLLQVKVTIVTELHNLVTCNNDMPITLPMIMYI